MGKKSVLGKGIGALLNTSIATPTQMPPREKEVLKEKLQQANTQITSTPLMVDVSKLKPNTHQPRRVFKENDLEELAKSIKENGIIQPLIVTLDEENKEFEIIAGERRFRAAQKAGLTKVPVVMKKVTKKDKLVMAIIENVQRSDLNCVEEALAYFQLMEEFNLTQEEVAKKVGKERSTVANFLRVLKMPKEIIIYLQKELLSLGHAKVLASLGEPKRMIALGTKAVNEKLSVRDLEKEVQALKKGAKPTVKKGNKYFDEKIDAYRRKLEQKTGFHFDIKSKKAGKGEVTIKYNNEAEFNDIYEFLLS